MLRRVGTEHPQGGGAVRPAGPQSGLGRVEPLRRVHECAFAVLALESEPVDPRL